jgi:methionyl-tRNA formyltransferase
MNNFKIGLFADGVVGSKVVDFLLINHRDDVGFICLTSFESSIFSQCTALGFEVKKIFVHDDFNPHSLNSVFDYFILAWWPYIVKPALFKVPKVGTINFHPSYLPYNKGKHPSFWNIIEEVPYGITLHFVDDGIDSGDILFQKEIKKDWSDTGGTLYEKALQAIVQLFIDNYDDIKYGRYTKKKQPNGGSFHYAKELKNHLKLDLDKTFTVREFLNLLRAKEFPDSPQCYFYDENNKYEIRISIRKLLPALHKSD